VDERSVINFVNHELQLLDARRFEEWADLFTEDGYYWAPVSPEQTSPQEHVSLFFDDKSTMLTRIRRLRHPQVHVQTPPSRTVHLVSNFNITQPTSQELIDVRCNFILFEYRPQKEQNLYGGFYEYNLIADPGSLNYWIKQKKATLVNSEDSFSSLAIWF
jgi:3-phenylpropionate/cinnamic acid dioxygenase small subunit